MADSAAPKQETRPVLFITYAYDDPDDAPVLDVSGSLAESRRNAPVGFAYRLERLSDGAYGPGQFVESRAEQGGD